MHTRRLALGACGDDDDAAFCRLTPLVLQLAWLHGYHTTRARLSLHSPIMSESRRKGATAGRSLSAFFSNRQRVTSPAAVMREPFTRRATVLVPGLA